MRMPLDFQLARCDLGSCEFLGGEFLHIKYFDWRINGWIAGVQRPASTCRPAYSHFDVRGDLHGNPNHLEIDQYDCPLADRVRSALSIFGDLVFNSFFGTPKKYEFKISETQRNSEKYKSIFKQWQGEPSLTGEKYQTTDRFNYEIFSRQTRI